MTNHHNYFLGLAQGFKTARYATALNRLSDAQLSDIGIARRDIARRARELAGN